MKPGKGGQLVRGPVNGPNVESCGAGRSGAQREGGVNWKGNCDFTASSPL